MSRSLWRSSLVVSAMTLLSRFFGLLRDILIARYFDSHVTDPFFAALRIPNTLRRFFAEGSFSNAFIPVFSATKVEQPEALPDLLRHVSGTLLWILLVISALGSLFAGSILALIASGLIDKAQQFALAEDMLRIMFPYILFISLTALSSAVLNSFQQFAVPAFTPVLFNLALIAACYWHEWSETTPKGIELAWGVFIGGILQFLWQFPFLKRLNVLRMPKWGWQHKEVRRIIRLMLPTLFGSSVGQLTVLVNTFLAASMATGSISWLYYADRMVELPVALIGVALGTVILPKLSALKQQNNDAIYIKTVDWALRWALLLGGMSAVILMVLAPSIISTLFYRGAFSQHDWFMSASALQFYSIGAFFMIMIKVLAPAFYAQHDTKTPVKAGLMAMILNIVLAFILSPTWGHLGLAAATSISSGLNMLLLIYFLKRQGLIFKRQLWGLGLRFIMSLIGFAFVLHTLQGNTEAWLERTAWERLLLLLSIVSSSIAVYLGLLWTMGFRWQHWSYSK